MTMRSGHFSITGTEIGGYYDLSRIIVGLPPGTYLRTNPLTDSKGIGAALAPLR
jgi:hypothetical protein